MRAQPGEAAPRFQLFLRRRVTVTGPGLPHLGGRVPANSRNPPAGTRGLNDGLRVGLRAPAGGCARPAKKRDACLGAARTTGVGGHKPALAPYFPLELACVFQLACASAAPGTGNSSQAATLAPRENTELQLAIVSSEVPKWLVRRVLASVMGQRLRGWRVWCETKWTRPLDLYKKQVRGNQHLGGARGHFTPIILEPPEGQILERGSFLSGPG